MRQGNETRLEMRSRKLGDAISRRVDIVTQGLRPPGQRPSFTQQLSKPDALNWWLKNWGNPQTGGRVLSQMDPMSQLELHAALSDHIDKNNLMGAGMMGAGMDKATNAAAPTIGMSTTGGIPGAA